MIVSAIFYLPVYFILRRKVIPILKQLSWALLGGVIGCMAYEIIVRLFFTKHEFESKAFEMKWKKIPMPEGHRDFFFIVKLI